MRLSGPILQTALAPRLRAFADDRWQAHLLLASCAGGRAMTLRIPAALFLGLSVATASIAEDKAPDVDKRDLIYGGEIMTPEEIADYHRRLSGDVDSEEREKFLREHRERMDARADERGVELKEGVAEPGEKATATGGGGGGGNAPTEGGTGTRGDGVGGAGGVGGVTGNPTGVGP
jgi:hypothetical protein